MNGTTSTSTNKKPYRPSPANGLQQTGEADDHQGDVAGGGNLPALGILLAAAHKITELYHYNGIGLYH
jgi:hypothetical protein